MRVKGLVWGGTKTERFDESFTFFKNVMGMEVDETEAWFASFRLPDGAKFEVFAPQESEHDFFTRGPVIGFGVDDVEDARAELEGAGVEFIGPIHRQHDYLWSHFYGPDGNVYEIGSG